MPKVYGLIPARSGSTRFPNKNVSPFNGRPLYEWTLDFSTQSNLFDKLFVSTDIPEIKNKVPKGMHVLDRPEYLATSNATLLQVIQHLIDSESLENDATLVLLPVTGVLRLQTDLTSGLEKFKEFERNRTVVPVSQNLHPPGLLWEMEGESLIPREKSDDPLFTQKDKHKPTYLWNDLFLIDTCGNWEDPSRNLYGSNPVAQLIPVERCMPIDYPIQFELAERLADRQQEKGAST